MSEVVTVECGPREADALGRFVVLEQPLDRSRRHAGDVRLQPWSWKYNNIRHFGTFRDILGHLELHQKSL